jgi:putative chitobiose transport system substrate-binding protein
MNLAISRQTALPKESLSFALFLTDGPNQTRFASQARVLPSSRAALKAVAADLDLERPADAQGRLVRQARQLSVETLEHAQVLVPPSPGVKRLQTVIYTQLQRAMLGQISSDRALAEAERQWNSYATARWP